MFRKVVRSHILKKKDDSLGTLLHETIQKQREEIRTAMMKFHYFNSWPEDKIHQCCVHSNILNYGENDIVREPFRSCAIINEMILVKDDANVDVTNFILEGKVTVIQRLVVQMHKDKRYPPKIYYTLYKDQSATVDSKTNLEYIYMQTCQMRDGATFGLGEELSKHVIIAHKGTKCLVIPKHIVLQQFSLDNIWEKIILFLNIVYPSLETVFEDFLIGRKWKEYSENVYNSIINRAPPTNICIHDTPLMYRAMDLKYKRCYRGAKDDPLYLLGERNFSVPLTDILNISSHKLYKSNRKKNINT